MRQARLSNERGQVAIPCNSNRGDLFPHESAFVLGVGNMSTARYCKNCGKKYYPKSFYSYPQFYYGTSDEDKLEYARFHSLGCMTDWLNRNKQAFAHLVDTISDNVIKEETTIDQIINQ